MSILEDWKGLPKQINEVGKQVANRKRVWHTVEGLSDETIMVAKSINQGIKFVDFRQTFINFEEKNSNTEKVSLEPKEHITKLNQN